MIPSYLYHYTSVDTLLKVLTTTSIRFKRLDLMNDPLEGLLEKFQNTRKFVFSSSWSAQSMDEIPMWKMYNNHKGIRLKMPIDLFDHEKNMVVSKIGRSNNYLINTKLDRIYSAYKSGFVFKEGQDKRAFEFSKVYGPTKIEYTSNQDQIYKDIVRKDFKIVDFDFYEIDLNLIGQKKIDYWSFEKEYRFRLFLGDAIMIAGSENVLTNIHKEYPIAFEYVDVSFRKQALEDIEIILGPLTTDEDKIQIELKLIELEIKQYTIEKSKIKITAPNK